MEEFEIGYNNKEKDSRSSKKVKRSNKTKEKDQDKSESAADDISENNDKTVSKNTYRKDWKYNLKYALHKYSSVWKLNKAMVKYNLNMQKCAQFFVRHS